MQLRSVLCTVPDEIAARMPVAYEHFVQVLVDVLCLMAPFALFPRAGLLTFFFSPLVCLFFEGLMELCKTLLDPFGNRRVSNADFRADVQVDVLIAESNSGLGLWPRRVECLSKHTATQAAIGAASQPAAPMGRAEPSAGGGGAGAGFSGAANSVSSQVAR